MPAFAQQKPLGDHSGAGDEEDGTVHATTESKLKEAIDEYIEMYKNYVDEENGRRGKAAADEASIQVYPACYPLPPLPTQPLQSIKVSSPITYK